MFQKFSAGSKPVSNLKNTQSSSGDKNREMLDKLSRIEESYVDAAIRSVRRRFAGRRDPGFQS